MTRYASEPPEELWRIAYHQKRAQQGSTAVVEEEAVDYFESEAGALARLRNLVPNNGRILSIHKLAHVDGGMNRQLARWVELTYAPPAAQGTLTPTPPPQAAKP